jgi:hypothetical protein
MGIWSCILTNDKTAGNPGSASTKKRQKTAGKSKIPPKFSTKNGGKVETCAAAETAQNCVIF